MDASLDRYIRYKCMGRDVRVSVYGIIQAVADVFYQEGLVAWQKHVTGSMFEGLPEEVCNDRDFMFVHKPHPRVLLSHPEKDCPDSYLIANMLSDNPAYLTLSVVPGVKYEENIEKSMITSSRSSSLLGSRRFVEVLNNEEGILLINGPAAVRPTDKKKVEKGSNDTVDCLKASFWAPVAAEFLARDRKSGWPPRDLLQKIHSAGCHIVPVGHSRSENKDVEWRWSFSVAERELIHAFSDEMYAVMYVLKSIKNKHWKQEGKPTTFCSYFIKTACLWVCEETDTTNIMDLCREVIDWLLACYRTHRLPHYFIPEQNLIGHLQHDMCTDTMNWLDKILQSVPEFVLNSVDIDADVADEIKEFTRDKLYPEDIARESSRGLERFHPASPEFVQRQRQMWSDESYASGGQDLWKTMQKRIDRGAQLSVVMSLPERIILPMISRLPDLVRNTHDKMFESAMYRVLGDLYAACYISYTQGKDVDTLSTCYEHIIDYYTKGLQMVYPDGWSDRGLGGYVRLATFYHLKGDKEKLGETLGRLEPLLQWGMEEAVINSVGIIRLDLRAKLQLTPWKKDMFLYKELVEPWDERWLFVHPVFIGYYLLVQWIAGTDHTSNGNKLAENEIKISEIISSLRASVDTINKSTMHKSGLIILQMVLSLAKQYSGCK